jgi:hypothetical protein
LYRGTMQLCSPGFERSSQFWSCAKRPNLSCRPTTSHHRWYEDGLPSFRQSYYFALMCSFVVWWQCQVTKHALNRRQIDHRRTVLDVMLKILTQVPAASDSEAGAAAERRKSRISTLAVIAPPIAPATRYTTPLSAIQAR